MQIGAYEFNLRELSGAMGDFGTLIPLAIGYIVVCGLNPSGLLVTIGLANIITGLIYKLPMPIEPMKVLAVVAIAQGWTPSMVYASGFGMGIVWIIFALTGLMKHIARFTPKSVIRGIQVALGGLLAIEALKMVSDFWLLGIISVIVILLLRNNRYMPAAVTLVVLGIAIMYFRGDLTDLSGLEYSLPSMTFFKPIEVWETMLLAGFAQIPLTATNAVISTSSLINSYFPGRSVGEGRLSLNMGLMNILFPFLGGMPLCHGAGGLAGQYYFGARTGGANIIEGMIEIAMGILLATSIAGLFALFPMAIIGAMMFMVGIELIKFSRDVSLNWNMIVLAVTVLVSVLTNMAFGFLAGLAVYYMITFYISRTMKKQANDDTVELKKNKPVE
ncbi:MAG: putative sulfate/molybdate transporter [Bacillota bacterium]|nr:putative sulfate/molybdate transporter [Bacillota bacterium]